MRDLATPAAGARIARRMAEIEPFHVMDLLARARELEAQGRSIIHMEIGEPDFPTPQPIIDAGMEALKRGDIHYTPALGLPELREAVAGFYRVRYGVEVPASRIVITPGASGALLLAAGVLINPSDEVLVADPGYPCNRHFVRLMEGRPVGIPVGPPTQYQLTSDLIDAHWTPRTVAALLASPSNPTGAIVPNDMLRRIAAAVKEKGGTLMVDEIYHGLTYGEAVATALSISGEAFVINSFSKYFNMTGWRLGWLVAPQAYVREIEKLAQNVFISAPTPAQRAALAAFEPGTLAILEERRRQFRERRDYLLPALKELGFDIVGIPQGAFYLYAGCDRFSADSYAFARQVLERAGVAVTPGIDFGRHEANRHLRFAYTNSLANLREGVRRLGDFLKR